MSEEQGSDCSGDKAEQEECESMTRERSLETVNNASNGNDFLGVLTLLPNTAQRWGHSITMNAIIKIWCRSPIFKDQCDSFYAVKVKKGAETKVPSTFNSLSPSLQSALFNVASQVSPTNGLGNKLHSCFATAKRHLMNLQLLQNMLACLLIELHVLATCLWMKE